MAAVCGDLQAAVKTGQGSSQRAATTHAAGNAIGVGKSDDGDGAAVNVNILTRRTRRKIATDQLCRWR